MDETHISPTNALIGITNLVEQTSHLADSFRASQQSLNQSLQVFGEQMQTIRAVTYPTASLLDGFIAAIPKIEPMLLPQIGGFESIGSALAKSQSMFWDTVNKALLAPSVSDLLIKQLSIQYEPPVFPAISDFLSTQQIMFDNITKLSALINSNVFIAIQSSFGLKTDIDDAVTSFLGELTASDSSELGDLSDDYFEKMDSILAALADPLPLEDLPENIRDQTLKLRNFVNDNAVPIVALLWLATNMLWLLNNKDLGAASAVFNNLLMICYVLRDMSRKRSE